jgi:hypothetical protein
VAADTVASDEFASRYAGLLKPDRSGRLAFAARCSDSVRLPLGLFVAEAMTSKPSGISWKRSSLGSADA